MNQTEQRSLKILWFCFIAAIFIYLAIAVCTQYIEGLEIPPLLPESQKGIARIVAVVLASVTALVFMTWKARFIGTTTTQNAINPTQAYVIAFALADVIGIYGLVLSFLTGEGLNAPAAFSALALLLLILVRPRSEI